MITQNTVRTRATGLARRGVQLATLATVGALPLLSMGITIPAAMQVRKARQASQSEDQRLRERDDLAQATEPYEAPGRVQDLRAIARTLAELLPTQIEPLHEFGAVRTAAAAHGVELASLRRTRSHSAARSERSHILADEIVLTLRAPLATTFALVDELRASGLPTVVLGFDATRTNVRDPRFQTELRLGFLRRIPGTPRSQDTATPTAR